MARRWTARIRPLFRRCAAFLTNALLGGIKIVEFIQTYMSSVCSNSDGIEMSDILSAGLTSPRWIEVDPLGLLVPSGSRVTWTNLHGAGQDPTYLYHDAGIDHYNGDFIHYQTARASNDVGFGWVTLWMLSNENDAHAKVLTGDCLTLGLYSDLALFNRFMLREYNAGALTQAWSVINWAINTSYYITAERDETIGPFGQLQIRIYSDAARLNLLDTVTIVLTEKQDFRYIQLAGNHNTWVQQGTAQHGYVEDVDLNEGMGIELLDT